MKIRATFHISQELMDHIRNAVVALAGPPRRLTLAAFAEAALQRELLRLQRVVCNGRPFPPRDGDLKGGRPIGR